MTTLLQHYKDRNPEETIAIIQHFFESRNYQLKQINELHSIADTYSCSYYLYYNKYCVLQANGKGLSPIYAKASCFSEMYERFCLFSISNLLNPILSNDIQKQRKREKGYYLHIDEKELTTSDLLSDIYTQRILSYLCPIDQQEKYQNLLLDIFLNNKLYGIKYTNLNNINDNKYFNLALTSFYNKTTGMAAGNTIEEALVQGCSELFERIVVEKFYTDIQDKYYYLDITCLDLSIQRVIKNIENQNISIKIFDLSYNFNLPVCLAFIEDNAHGSFYCAFGAAPVIDIAVERCLTELFQGVQLLPSNVNPINKIDNNNIYFVCEQQRHSILGHKKRYFPSWLLNNEQIISYNKEIFLNNKQYNNQDLLAHLNRINPFVFYWTDISLDQNIKAVSIVSQTNELKYGNENRFLYFNNKTDQEKQLLIEFCAFIKNHLIKLKETNGNNVENVTIFIFNLFEKFQLMQEHPINILNNNFLLIQYLTYLLYPIQTHKNHLTKDMYNIIHILMNNENLVIFDSDCDYSVKYNNMKLQQILHNQKTDNNLLLINDVFIKTLQEIYQSNIYQNFIKTLI